MSNSNPFKKLEQGLDLRLVVNAVLTDSVSKSALKTAQLEDAQYRAFNLGYQAGAADCEDKVLYLLREVLREELEELKAKLRVTQEAEAYWLDMYKKQRDAPRDVRLLPVFIDDNVVDKVLNYGKQRIDSIKWIRNHFGCGLKDAKDLADKIYYSPWPERIIGKLHQEALRTNNVPGGGMAHNCSKCRNVYWCSTDHRVGYYAHPKLCGRFECSGKSGEWKAYQQQLKNTRGY